MKQTIKKITHAAKQLFILGVVISLGSYAAHHVSAADVEPYPESSGSLISKVGSLVLAPTPLAATLTGSFVNSFARCEKAGNTGTATRSCLDVQGTASFSNLITNNMRTFLLTKTFVGPAGGVGPAAQTVPLFVADTGSGTDSIMVSDLGRFNVSDEFEPVDETTMRGVCADANGEFYSCPVPVSPILNCPLTFTDPDNGIIYPIVDVDGACWFGRDMQRNQMDATNADRIYSFVTNDEPDWEGVSFPVRSAGYVLENVNDDLKSDIAFVKNAEGDIRVAFSSSAYLSLDVEFLDEPGVPDGAYRNINPAFESFLLNTCDWDADSMDTHTWDGEDYYIVDFQLAEHNDLAEPESVALRPSYNIICREWLEDDGADYDSLTDNFIEDTMYTSTSLKMAVYTVDQPKVSLLGNSDSGVFLHVKDLYDYTCPTGWHVPRRAEWSDLETAMNDRATDEGVDLNDSTLATEMAFENTGSINRYDFPDYGGRYYSREIIESNDPDYFSTSTYYEVTRDGYNLVDADGDVNFGLPTWKKLIASYSINWTEPEYYAMLNPAARVLVYIVDTMRVNVAEAAMASIRNGNIGKVRCVQGAELTAASGSWGSCEDAGGGEGIQTYTVSSCTIGGNPVDAANCANLAGAENTHGEKRSCILLADGDGGGF